MGILHLDRRNNKRFVTLLSLLLSLVCVCVCDQWFAESFAPKLQTSPSPLQHASPKNKSTFLQNHQTIIPQRNSPETIVPSPTSRYSNFPVVPVVSFIAVFKHLGCSQGSRAASCCCISLVSFGKERSSHLSSSCTRLAFSAARAGRSAGSPRPGPVVFLTTRCRMGIFVKNATF